MNVNRMDPVTSAMRLEDVSGCTVVTGGDVQRCRGTTWSLWPTTIMEKSLEFVPGSKKNLNYIYFRTVWLALPYQPHIDTSRTMQLAVQACSKWGVTQVPDSGFPVAHTWLWTSGCLEDLPGCLVFDWPSSVLQWFKLFSFSSRSVDEANDFTCYILTASSYQMLSRRTTTYWLTLRGPVYRLRSLL